MSGFSRGLREWESASCGRLRGLLWPRAGPLCVCVWGGASGKLNSVHISPCRFFFSTQLRLKHFRGVGKVDESTGKMTGNGPAIRG